MRSLILEILSLVFHMFSCDQFWRGVINYDDFAYFFPQVFASDADSGANGQIEYSIVSGNPNEAFVVDSVRGILATKVLLDREITPSYKYADY